jgi:hypothetical protein
LETCFPYIPAFSLLSDLSGSGVSYRRGQETEASARQRTGNALYETVERLFALVSGLSSAGTPSIRTD